MSNLVGDILKENESGILVWMHTHTYTHTEHMEYVWGEFNSNVPLWFLLLKLWSFAPLKKTWIIGTGCRIQPPITQATANENSIGKDPSSLLLCQYWSPLAVSGDIQRCQRGELRKLSRAAHSMALYQLDHIYIFIFTSSTAMFIDVGLPLCLAHNMFAHGALIDLGHCDHEH